MVVVEVLVIVALVAILFWLPDLEAPS